MRPFPFDGVKVVNLTDLYLTREEHNRVMRRAHKKISSCQGGIFATCIMIGVLFGAVIDQKRRIDELEERLNKKDETAG